MGDCLNRRMLTFCSTVSYISRRKSAFFPAAGRGRRINVFHAVGAAESRERSTAESAENDQNAVKAPEQKLTIMQAAEAGDETRIRSLLQRDARQLQDTDKVRVGLPPVREVSAAQ